MPEFGRNSPSLVFYSPSCPSLCPLAQPVSWGKPSKYSAAECNKLGVTSVLSLTHSQTVTLVMLTSPVNILKRLILFYFWAPRTPAGDFIRTSLVCCMWVWWLVATVMTMFSCFFIKRCLVVDCVFPTDSVTKEGNMHRDGGRTQSAKPQIYLYLWVIFHFIST